MATGIETGQTLHAPSIAKIAIGRDLGDRIAVCLSDISVTYRELNRRADFVAKGLRSATLPGPTVAYLSQADTRFYELLIGTARAHGVFLPLNWRLSPAELLAIVNLSKPDMLVADATYEEVARALHKDAALPFKLLIVGGGGSRDVADYESWRDEQVVETGAGNPFAPNPETEAIRLYTSGTTGLPKGVQLTHGNFSAVFDCFPRIGLDYSNARVLAPLPLFHVAGIAISLHTLASGGTVIMAPDAKPSHLLDLIERHRVTDTFIVPAIILSLVQQSKDEDRDLSSIRTIAYGAAPISEDLLKQASAIFECSFIQLYGLTETTGTATYLPAADHAPEKNLLRSCGKASPGLEIRVVDEEGSPVEAQVVGEIQIRGATVAAGYLNDPEATQAAFCDDWFKTGDAGYFDENGYIFLHDRIKDMIVSGGENIYPAEVENAIFGHPDVADVAVIGIPDAKWGEAVMAIIVPRPGCEPGADDIVAWARQKIAGYKLPKVVITRDDLPRTPSGKILRRQLREEFWSGQVRRVG